MSRRRSAGAVGARWKSMPLGTRLLAIAIGPLACWTILGFAVQYLHTYTLARDAAGLERRRQELLDQNASLLSEIHRLRTDDQYLERLAREQLGMLRPGEMELVIVPAGPPRPDAERGPVANENVGPDGPLPTGVRLIRSAARTLRTILERAFGAFPRGPR